MCIRSSLLCGIVLLGVTTLACGKESPTPSAPSPPPPPTLRIERTGDDTLQPGLKVQMKATLVTSSGAATNCTDSARWSSSNDALARTTGQQPGEFVIAGVGDGAITAACDSINGTFALHVDQPTSWPISGRVLAGPGGAPVAGATLALEGYAPTTTDGSGRFRVITPNAATRHLIVQAPGFVTYDTYLRGGELRELDLPLIGATPPYPTQFAREILRNGRDVPGGVATQQLLPWETDPNIYIRTIWRDTGAPVANLDYYIAQIQRAVPLLTAGKRKVGRIETGPEQRPFEPGWIEVWFDHSGNYGYVGGYPIGNVQFAGDFLCASIAVMHEFGHAMGLWHSSQRPSVMGGGPASCADADLTPEEQMIVATLYSRQRGNLDPDRDPVTKPLLTPVAPSAQARVDCDTIVQPPAIR